MNKQINPVLAIIIIVVFIAIVGVVMWKNLPQPAPPGQGRKQSDLDLSRATKDPAQFQKEVQELLARDRAEHGNK
jgi:Cu/Ag efflux pump CusA